MTWTSIAMGDGVVPLRIARAAALSFQIFMDTARPFQFSEMPTAALIDQLAIQPMIVTRERGDEKLMAVVAGFYSYCALIELEGRSQLPKSISVQLISGPDVNRAVQADLFLRLTRLPHPVNAAVVRRTAELLSPENALIFDGKTRVSAETLAERFQIARHKFTRSQLNRRRKPILSKLLEQLRDEP